MKVLRGLFRFAGRLFVVAFTVFIPTWGQADVVRDGTLGPGGSAQPTGPHYEIGETLGELRDGNLFHSFSEFSLTQDQSATFTATSPVTNIISRVTGSSISNIDGLLRSTVPGADLYLLNPRGIIFGPNAKLDVQGAFHASTAQALQFADGGMFSVDAAAPALLSTAAPEAFGFLGPTAGLIELNGSVLESRQDIVFNAASITLNDGARIATNTEDHNKGGDVSLTATERITLSGVDESGFGSRVWVTTEGDGDGGSVSMQAPIIELLKGATAGTLTFGRGRGGDVFLTAGDRLVLAGNSMTGVDFGNVGTGSGLGAATFSLGNAGSLFAEASVIEIQDGGFMITGSTGAGAGGNLTVLASQRLSLSGANTGGVSSFFSTSTITDGDSGELYVEAPFIELQDGAVLVTGTRGSGKGGDLSVVAKERLELSGTAAISYVFYAVAEERGGGARFVAGTTAEGDGGSIYIDAPFISLDDAALIESVSSGNGGDAGAIQLDANVVRLSGRSSISTEAAVGEGGGITIRADNSTILDDSEITTNVRHGNGDSGAIHVDTELLVLDQSRITAQADSGRGGNIDIVAGYVLTSINSVVDASTSSGTDGQITITAPLTDVAEKMARLEAVPDDTQALLRYHCDGHSSQPTSGHFRVARQQGLPLSPEDLLLAFDHGEPTFAAPQNMVATTANNDWAAQVDGNSAEVSRTTARDGHHLTRGETLRDLAQHRQATGFYGASLEILNGALTHARDIADHRGVALALGQAGNAQLALGDSDTAEHLFDDALTWAEVAGDKAVLATLFNNLGNLYHTQQRYRDALDTYINGARLAQSAGKPVQQAKALSNGARVALEAGFAEQARNLLLEGREIARRLPAGHAKATTLIHLARTAQRLGDVISQSRHHSLAMAYNDLREAATLSVEMSDPRYLSYALGNLGNLYRSEQRTGEALYLTRLAQQAAERANAPESLYRWYWQEGLLLQDQGETDEALPPLRRAVAVLEESRQETLAQYGDAHVRFRQAVAPVYMDLVNILLQRAAHLGSGHDDTPPLLKEAQATMEQLKAAELRDYFRNECIAGLEAESTRLEAVSAEAAVIYPILLPERLELLVSLPSGLQHYTVPVDAASLKRAISDFRTLIETLGPETDIRVAGLQLYRWLVQPYAPQLDGINTLVFVPDGPLRTVPLAALHDGDDYLIHRFRVVVTPGLALTDPRPLDRQDARFVLAGVSQPVQHFPALPAVRREIESVREMFGGRVLLDQAFTQSQFEQALKTPVSVVHIASHAQFTGEAESSFLLTYDGRMSMSDFDEALSVTRFRDQPLELLVLSACQTAAGDERAALGLAGVGIRAGARSALGSLWSINDEATATLITTFYRNLQDPAQSRAQALQAAQQALLVDTRFNHPYFWSPYLLINNWL